ncbi:MAG TPA: arsenate reductase ArsC [Acidimicrobiales bacterium]
MPNNHLIEDLPSSEQRPLQSSLSPLLRKFAGVFDDETVERFLVDSYERLATTSKNPSFLSIFAERFAWERLGAMAKVETTTEGKPGVLFLCVHNAGRSQMAAGWLRHIAGDHIDVYTGGSEPADSLNPVVVEAMVEVGIDISEEFPKPWTEEVVKAVDAVISMGCGDVCPIYPGKKYTDWELDDPAGMTLEGVRNVRDELKVRVRGLRDELLAARS